MTQQNEVESLKITNAIQQKVIQARGDELVEAIICLHKILPIARAHLNSAELKGQLELQDMYRECILRANKFLSDER